MNSLIFQLSTGPTVAHQQTLLPYCLPRNSQNRVLQKDFSQAMLTGRNSKPLYSNWIGNSVICLWEGGNILTIFSSLGEKRSTGMFSGGKAEACPFPGGQGSRAHSDSSACQKVSSQPLEVSKAGIWGLCQPSWGASMAVPLCPRTSALASSKAGREGEGVVSPFNARIKRKEE